MAHEPDMPDTPDMNDEVLAQLTSLPGYEVDHQTGERIRRRGKAAFVRHHRAAQNTWLGALERLYWRVELVMVGGVSIVYLAWAVNEVLSLHR